MKGLSKEGWEVSIWGPLFDILVTRDSDSTRGRQRTHETAHRARARVARRRHAGTRRKRRGSGRWIPVWRLDLALLASPGGKRFGEIMQNVDAFLLGRRTYEIHAHAFEPMPAGDPFGDMMNAPRKYVVSKTLKAPIWRNTTIIRENVLDAVRELRKEHRHGWQQSACSRADRERPRGRVAPPHLSSRIG